MEIKSVYVVTYMNRYYETSYANPGDYDTVEAFVSAVFETEEDAYEFIASELANGYEELMSEHHDDVHIIDNFIYYDGHFSGGYTVGEFMVLRRKEQ